MLSRNDFLSWREALESLHDESAKHLGAEPEFPAVGSIGAKELSTFPRRESVKTAYSQGGVCLEATADYVQAIIKTLTEPVQTIAPWTCARAAVESSSLGCWFFDPHIGVKERVARSLSFRYEGLDQQRKASIAKGDAAKAEIAQERLGILAEFAKDLGFDAVVNKKGRMCGAGQRLPTFVELARDVLDQEDIYRLLSGFVHSHPWALQEGSFQTLEGQPETVLEKAIHPEAAGYLFQIVGRIFGRIVWARCVLFGGNQETLGGIFERVFLRLGMENRRLWFWKETPPK